MFFDFPANGGDSFIAAWGTVFDHWTEGFEYDFTTGKFSFIGGKTVDQLKANLPSDISEHPYSYSVAYQPDNSVASGPDLQAQLQDANLSTDGQGQFHVTWDGIDPTTKVYMNLGGSSVQVWGSGVDTNQPIVDTPDRRAVRHLVHLGQRRHRRASPAHAQPQ